MNSVATLAGSVSTALFIGSTLPMLYKAARTKNLGSYSVGNIVLAERGQRGLRHIRLSASRLDQYGHCTPSTC